MAVFYAVLRFGSSARANPQPNKRESIIIPQFLSAKSLADDRQYFIPFNPNLATKKLDYSLFLESSDRISNIIDLANWQIENNNLIFNVTSIDNSTLSLDNNPYVYDRDRSKAILGFHNTFWPSQNGQKYWGVTTVEELGAKSNDNPNAIQNSNDPESILPSGISTLIVSGGGKKNLVTKTNLLGEFEDFRGGVALRRGLSKNLTLGIGLVYEDLARGYSQFTFKPEHFPLKTTVSLVSGEEGLDIRSHLKFQPTDNFVINYYSKTDQQKFDVDWGLVSGLNLLAKGNSQDESFSTGFKLAINSEYFALSAKAELDEKHNWQWQIDSRWGGLHFIHASNLEKSNSELNYELLDAKTLGFQCSVFVKNETQMLKNNEQYLNVWGWRLSSAQKFDARRLLWSFDIGYGVGSQGQGAIASTAMAVSPDLFLKLTYQEISPVSDDMNLKLQLGSR